MKVLLVTFCLIGAVFANPIALNVVLESNDLDVNSTESLSLSQSSENDTSLHQSSEEITSEQSSESESLETTSEDTTSEESNSQSDEDDQITNDLISETRDDSMGSEENVRKNLVPVFASVVKALSAEDDNSTEVKGQPDLSGELTDKQPGLTAVQQGTKILPGDATLQKLETLSSSSSSTSTSSDSTSDSADTSDLIAATAAAPVSSESASSESVEASDESQSPEDSAASDGAEMAQVKAQLCVNGTQSCESEEDFFQTIGDDGNDSVDNLLAPDEDERELSLRRR